MILAIDFDGVIHDYRNPPPGKRMGPPIAGAKETIWRLKNLGHSIIVFTVRAKTPSGEQAVRDWLHYFNIPFDEITNVKENFDLIIDDRAIRFISWPVTELAIADVGPRS